MSRPASLPAHPHLIGEGLSREHSPIGVSRAGWWLLASLAAAMMFTLTGMIIRQLSLAEAAWQLAARV